MSRNIHVKLLLATLFACSIFMSKLSCSIKAMIQIII